MRSYPAGRTAVGVDPYPRTPGGRNPLCTPESEHAVSLVMTVTGRGRQTAALLGMASSIGYNVSGMPPSPVRSESSVAVQAGGWTSRVRAGDEHARSHGLVRPGFVDAPPLRSRA